MTYTVPKSKASIRQNRFEFDVEGSKTKFSIPLMKYLPVGVIEKLSADQKPGIVDLLVAFGDGTAADAVRKLDGEQLTGLMEAWQAESGITLEKS